MSKIISVTKTFDFCYSHFLPYHQGQCRNLHGHNAKVEVTVSMAMQDFKEKSLRTPGEPDCCMVIDFGQLKVIMNKLIDSLDHTHLNDNHMFSCCPTAENTAGLILTYCTSGLRLTKAGKYGAWVSRVVVYETPGNYATITQTQEDAAI